MKVIEPTEILVDGEGTVKDDPIRANPWLRFLARMFDYTLFFFILFALRKVFNGPLPFGSFESVVPYEYFVWIPVEAILLSVFGTTIGKWLVGTDLKQGRKEKLDFFTALRRSFNVWFRGIGLGIPFINGFCMILAYNRLKLFKVTSWDRDDHIQISHHAVAPWRVIFTAVVAIVGQMVYFNVK